jgi:predicted O-linked N-acetylglucosamine transferase (SPINDLY family)
MVTIDEALARGTRHHQAGQWAEAEHIYRQILNAEPAHAPTLHQLGILVMQGGNYQAAVECFAQAIRADQMQAAYHANQGVAYASLGNLAQAIVCYQAAVTLQPDLAHVHRMLGVACRVQGDVTRAIDSLRTALKLKPDDNETRTQLGHALHKQGKLSEAETCFRRALRGDPESATAYFNLGDALHAQQKLDEAATHYQEALRRNPDYVDAHNNLGTILNGQGESEAAVAHYLAALRVRADCAAAHTNLGGSYLALGRSAEAIASYRAALQIDPLIVIARHNLGTLLQQQGQLTEALACFDEALRIDPRNAPLHMARGSVLQVQTRFDAAIASFQAAVHINPNYAEAYNNMGVAWGDQGLRDESIECLERALALDPHYAAAESNLSGSLQYLGRLDEAVEHGRRSVELEPGNSGFHSNLLYLLNYHPAHDATSIAAEHRTWAQRHADPLFAVSAPHTNERTPTRRLRIGYVSPNFKDHAVNFFSEPILVSHDHAQFEVFCYSDVRQADATTRGLQGCVDQWRDTSWLSDQQLSDLVRRDQIDILVDLNGHIGGGSRMLAFARKPAPVQVTYIGYQNTTGMLAMDYRLTDDYSDPPGTTDAFYTEQLVRLPRSFFCYLPSNDAPPVTRLPAMELGYVTFGSVNNFNKISPAVLTAWAQLLARVPNSRLVVRADMTDSLRGYLRRSFATHGVDSGRLELVNRLPRLGYLELINRLDMALDPFPFNGHTTTCDCLWQGVPVVTLSGDTYASRFGGSGLVTLGLDAWIARTTEQYVQIAAAIAANLEPLAQLRAELRSRMAASPLLDFAGFTQNLETAYRRMWIDWCAKRGH